MGQALKLGMNELLVRPLSGPSTQRRELEKVLIPKLDPPLNKLRPNPFAQLLSDEAKPPVPGFTMTGGGLGAPPMLPGLGSGSADPGLGKLGAFTWEPPPEPKRCRVGDILLGGRPEGTGVQPSQDTLLHEALVRVLSCKS